MSIRDLKSNAINIGNLHIVRSVSLSSLGPLHPCIRECDRLKRLDWRLANQPSFQGGAHELVLETDLCNTFGEFSESVDNDETESHAH